MSHTVEKVAERVIELMHNDLSRQLTIDEMARTAMFSKFHFSRIFQKATGVTPARFLSALRLQRAKQLLVSTSMTVADISIQVGYTSVGTFSSRFSRSVGLSPTTYRRLGGFTPQVPVMDHALPESATGSVSGAIRASSSHEPALIFAGLFPDRIPEGRPVRCAIMREPGHLHLDRVPEGEWYLLAHSVAGNDPEGSLAEPYPACVGSVGPLTVRRGTVTRSRDLQLSPTRSVDPPVLLALLDVRRAAVHEQSRRELAAAAA
ncbi:helix-turn-helix domain-containing protein [Micromonospora sp. H33]|uniref:helix-turn-helix domain-containing protein n=1 Tax=Micromonospora sp. H33 TaxID=3452215 RepID=UPI003F8BF6BA